MPKKKWFWNDITDGLLRRLYDPTVKGRSREPGLDLEELMAEAEHIADRGSLDRQAVSWLLSHL
jgi:hypothetical protein